MGQQMRAHSQTFETVTNNVRYSPRRLGKPLMSAAKSAFDTLRRLGFGRSCSSILRSRGKYRDELRLSGWALLRIICA